ncbi:uncharacterized protein MYCGRDRAFT_96335 [Zymoseptoria tritici IPO323]|uniref:Uncharacterized protein n=1 Tax=Zymoseptoria tritici (strain CBS 115943 / IPO323) TaxID=336722 RepID=F9XLS6_ZYMTI|nr:uncharacterized protein MYCGRDRAFT_96335 [Zymoseptoria tritici IPO323]EGP84037.1 hypothetical protein MYCGRDRAFT_96335 [Zymoseptoria tritici IPO323]
MGSSQGPADLTALISRLTALNFGLHAKSGTYMPEAELMLRLLARIREVVNSFNGTVRLEEDSSSDDKDGFKSILPYNPATPKKRGREEDVNKTPEEQTNGQPRFPMYKGNVKSKKKRGNKGGEVIYRKGDVKYSEAIAHYKTIWNKAFPCAICKDLRNAEYFEIKEYLG